MDPQGDVRAAQHLLRNLANPHALRRNELVSPLFAHIAEQHTQSVMEDITSLVFRAIASMSSAFGADYAADRAARHQAILTQYEIGRRSHDEVARSLGIGTRKFYYERRAALGRFADAVRRAVPGAAAALNVASWDIEDERRHARHLSEIGEFELAAGLAMNASKHAARAVDRIALLCQAVESMSEAGRTAQATSLFIEVQHILRREMLEERAVGRLQARLNLAGCKLQFQRGNFEEALRTAEHVRAQIASSGFDDEAMQLLYAETLGEIGALQTFFGRIDEATRTYDEAIDVAENCKSPTPLLADLLWGQARCYSGSHTADGLKAARERNAEALDLATRVGQLHTIVRAHTHEAVFEYWDGRWKSALEHGRLAMAIANSISGPEEKGLALLSLARVEAAEGNGRRALRRIAQARTDLPETCYAWVYSYIIESQVFLILNQNAAAIQSAKTAVKNSRRNGRARGLGAAMHLLAEAQDRLGKDKAAIVAIRDALSELECAGDPFTLAAAYECSARLTGNRCHLLNAADLRAMLAQGPMI